jgi:hypothetical protein
MSIFDSFLSCIYELNYSHDQMSKPSRDHTIIQLGCLVMVISMIFPMAICIDTNLDYPRTAWLMFSICMAIACAFRIPYKMGKLNKYAIKKVENNNNFNRSKNDSFDELVRKINYLKEELDIELPVNKPQKIPKRIKI